jgi:serpin B
VNAWARRQTQGQVTTLLDTRSNCQAYDLLLVDALCFRGSWTVPFDPAWTEDGTFTRRGGARVACSLMHRTGIMDYVRTARYQAARLGYGRGRFGMVLVLPAPGVDLGELAAGLDPDSFKALAGSMDSVSVRLALPRFSCAFTGELRGPLTDLGMGLAFDPGRADFSAMAATPQVILGVVHQARIAVDELGTLAAAGSTVEMAPTSVLSHPRPMVLDRPFLLAITDRVTGSVLFLGRVLDPSGPSGT